MQNRALRSYSQAPQRVSRARQVPLPTLPPILSSEVPERPARTSKQDPRTARGLARPGVDPGQPEVEAWPDPAWTPGSPRPSRTRRGPRAAQACPDLACFGSQPGGLTSHTHSGYLPQRWPNGVAGSQGAGSVSTSIPLKQLRANGNVRWHQSPAPRCTLSCRRVPHSHVISGWTRPCVPHQVVVHGGKAVARVVT